MDEGDPRLSRSFGTAATAYDEYRPDYAQDAVRWALAPAPGPRVLDLGAGTGKLTGVLAALGADVVAVEPDQAMLVQLQRGLPGVRAMAGSAESVPLPDGSVDAVLAGHALHWFDPAAAGAEIARVLAPGGVLAGLWNVLDDRVGWVAGLRDLGGDAVLGPRDTQSRWRAATAGLVPAGFGAAEQAEFPHEQRSSPPALAAKIATHAGLLVMPVDERARLLARLRAYLAAQPEAADGTLTLPMISGVLRTRPLRG